MPRQKVLVLVRVFQQIGREIDGRQRMRDRPHCPDYVPKSVLFGQHVVQIAPLADYLLNPFGVQESGEPHAIAVAVGFHLEDEIAQVAEAEATMPARVRE